MNRKQVLVIEDNLDIANLIRMHLQDHGVEVCLSHDGQNGLRQAEQNNYNLIILDLMLPELDGLDICRCLREQHNYTPILMLTAKSSELDRVLGLETGADDYLTKPFSVNELLARVKAIFRRHDSYSAPGKDNSQTIQIGELIVDFERHSVSLQNRPLDLTATEFELLKHFAEHPGHVFSRTQLLDSVWGYGHDGYEHTVNSHINRLRAKIEPDPARPHYIQTVWGVGYKMIEHAETVS